MGKDKFEGGNLGEGQGSERFKTHEENVSLEALEDAVDVVSFEEAELLFEEDYLGPEKVKQIFGVLPERIPPIPFRREELERARELGQQLVFFSQVIQDKKGEIVSATFKHLMERYPKAKDGNKMVVMIHDPTAAYRIEEVPRAGWRLVSKDVIPDTRGKQTIPALGRLLGYYQRRVSLTGERPPQAYIDATEEYRERGARTLQASMNELNWRNLIVPISELKVSQYFCERAVECLYRLILTNQLHGTRLLTDVYARTMSAKPESGHVTVGFFDEEGVVEGLSSPLEGYEQVGMCFSRGAVE